MSDEPEQEPILPTLTDGRLSQLKMLADKQGWDEVKHDCISEQQIRMGELRQ
jgi:hypothetical protein